MNREKPAVAISTMDGVLAISAVINIPNAEAGTWSPARMGRFIDMITREAKSLDDADAADREARANGKQS